MGDATDPAVEWAAVCEARAEAGREGTPWRAGMRPISQSRHTLNRPETPDDLRAVSRATSYFPDHQDPATLGCLLGLAREVFGCPHLSVVWSSEDQAWTWWFDYAEDDSPWLVLVGILGPTEYAALCRAIVAGLRRSQPVNTT